MKKKSFLAPVLLTIAVLLSFNGFSQQRIPGYVYDSTQFKKPWSWNLLFKPGTNKATRDKAVMDLEAGIREVFSTTRARFPGKYMRKLRFHVFFCPCDTLLYTLNTDIFLQGTGEVASQPPSAPPPNKGGGDQVVDYNYAVSNTENSTKENGGYKNNYGVRLPDRPKVDQSNILAIMDTGLDPSWFPPGIKKLIWNDGKGTTLYNFLPGKPVGKFLDDHPQRHGSAVTGMALGEIKNGTIWPAIMVMKVLDSEKNGSSFTVSCALSYAFQHHARLINMSLGYYSKDKIDAILNHYISRCVNASPRPITIFAAAGNLLIRHDDSMLCHRPDIRNQNLLSKEHLFYPACMNTAYPDLVSVTGLADNLQYSCFYQNYSPTYVTVGVVRKDSGLCCLYKFPFTEKGEKYYEGTSFATPIVSGEVMNAILAGSPGTSALGALGSLKKATSSLKNVTVKGSYITY